MPVTLGRSALAIVGSDGTVQVITVELTADGRGTPAGDHCVIAGSVTPTS